MYLDKTVAVVVPAKDEEPRIQKVLRAMPPLIDRVFVAVDHCTDNTAAVCREEADRDDRIVVLQTTPRTGVGAAIARGYRAAREAGHDIVVVMAGDGQMDPADLEHLIHPVATGQADYAKGNRFQYPRGLGRIPRTRKVGNFVLSVLTKIVSGYWHVSDSQCGYTAISREALAELDLERIYPSYGYPNDLLVSLNVAEMRVVEVPVNPRYGVGERSKMRIPRVLLPILWLLCRRFVSRIVKRYVVQNGHPLVFAYLFATLCLVGAGGLGIYLLVRFLATGWIMKAALITGCALLILGMQLLISAFSMDQEANRHLAVRLRQSRAGRPLDRGEPVDVRDYAVSPALDTGTPVSASTTTLSGASGASSRDSSATNASSSSAMT